MVSGISKKVISFSLFFINIIQPLKSAEAQKINKNTDKLNIKLTSSSSSNLKIKPFNSTPSANVGSVEVKTHTDTGAIKVVGIDKPVTIAGSILTSNANAAAELSGGAAEAKVKPVVIQFEKPIARQIKKVVLGKIISTKIIVVMTSSGLLNTENKLLDVEASSSKELQISKFKYPQQLLNWHRFL